MPGNQFPYKAGNYHFNKNEAGKHFQGVEKLKVKKHKWLQSPGVEEWMGVTESAMTH